MYPHMVLQAYKIYKETMGNLRGLFYKSYHKVWNPRFLNRSQWFTMEEIRELQFEGLKELVEHARKNTSYYKDLPKIKSLDDLDKIPILRKRDIKENFNRLLVKNVPGFLVQTGGTISKSDTIKDNRLKFDFGEQRFLSWYRNPLRKVCSLWGSTDIGKKPQKKWEQLYLPVELLNKREDAINFLRFIEQFKPDLIKAYANPLRFLAKYALEEGIQPEVGVIQSNCESLFPEARQEIEKAFQCEVFNFYGSEELGSMAQDCEIHGELHINAERYIVEEIDDRLLFTDLLNYAMPLIRYENQDIGKLSNRRCPCNRGLPTLKSLIGRTFDYLLTKNDKWLNVSVFSEPMFQDVFNWVASFQFKQDEKGEVTVLLKPWSDLEKIPELDTLMKTVYEHISRDELGVSIEIVDSIILSKSGKQKRLITKFSPWNE